MLCSSEGCGGGGGHGGGYGDGYGGGVCGGGVVMLLVVVK